MQFIQPREVSSNYMMLRAVDETLRDHNIPYWACGGTLLGAYRHGGFIPWDFDTDICIDGDINQFFDTVYISPNVHRVKIDNHYGHVDVYRVIEEPQRYMIEHSPHFFYKREVRIRRVQFGPIQINGILYPLPYLKRHYGENCMEIARIDYAKDEQGNPYPGFEIEDFSPAHYDDSLFNLSKS